MKKMNRLLTYVVLLPALLTSGCLATKIDADGFNLARLDSLVKTNETTLNDLRALFSTPTFIGETVQGDSIVGYTFLAADYLSGSFKVLGSTVLTLGAVSTIHPYTLKNAFFKLDKSGRVIEIKKNGYAYLENVKSNGDGWNECEFDLTDEEINSSVCYTNRFEIRARYAKEMAKLKGIAVKDIDTSEEFFLCDEKCHAKRGAIKAYGQFRQMNFDVKRESDDGSRHKESEILHNPIKQFEAETN